MRRKIAVTIPEEIVAKVERAVSEGQAPSVSAFVSQALEEKVGSGRRVTREEFTLIDALDGDLARVVGAVCARSGTSDIVDASVVVSAGLHDAVVATSDPLDLRRIDPSLEVVVL